MNTAENPEINTRPDERQMSTNARLLAVGFIASLFMSIRSGWKTIAVTLLVVGAATAWYCASIGITSTIRNPTKVDAGWFRGYGFNHDQSRYIVVNNKLGDTSGTVQVTKNGVYRQVQDANGRYMWQPLPNK